MYEVVLMLRMHICNNFKFYTGRGKFYLRVVKSSVVEPHHFYAASAPGENFDAAPAPAPTLLYSKAKFLKRTKVYTVYTLVKTILFI
jgi:hypothetical protein